MESIKQGCETVIREMVSRDPQRLGSRGSHRYAFANAPAHFGCSAAWAPLIDNPVALTVLEAIFQSPSFSCSGWGGDFVLPGAVEFQHLHRVRTPQRSAVLSPPLSPAFSSIVTRSD